MYEHFTICLVN